MRIGRTLPPGAAPISTSDILNGFRGLASGEAETRRFESEVRSHFVVRHCFLVSSAKAALTVTLRALKQIHPERSEVLVPAFICYSVPSAVLRAGLNLQLADTNPDTLDFDFQSLNATNSRISSKNLLAVVSAHVFGLPASLAPLREIFPDHDITLIEDAAQVFGSQHNGRMLGTVGDVGFFSLGRGKSVSTTEGGIIVTNNDEVATAIRRVFDGLPHYTKVGMMNLIIQSFLLRLFTPPSLFWFPKLLPFLKVGHTLFDVRFNIHRMSSYQAGLARTGTPNCGIITASAAGTPSNGAGAWETSRAYVFSTPLKARKITLLFSVFRSVFRIMIPGAPS